MKNIVFYFTGTGNSLKVSKDIATKLGDCELYSMGLEVPKLDKTYDTIGFVYPTYFGGMPSVVAKFVKQLDLQKQSFAYIFGITSYGGFVANGLRALQAQLLKKEMKLSYGNVIKMVDNYIFMYNTGVKVEEKTAKSDEALVLILDDIQARKKNSIKKEMKLIKKYTNMKANAIHKKAEFYTVSDDCISCDKCFKVCPVNNIKMVDGKPEFGKNCEQCMACFQYCPKHAINYKEKTKNRGQYVNPTISFNELVKGNQK